MLNRARIVAALAIWPVLVLCLAASCGAPKKNPGLGSSPPQPQAPQPEPGQECPDAPKEGKPCPSR